MQARRHGEHAARGRNVFPEEEHALVAGELLVERLAHGLAELDLGGRAGPRSRRSRGGRRRCRTGGRRPAGATDADPRDDRAERRGRPVVDDDLLEHAVGLGLVDHRRLVRLHLDEGLAAGDVVARRA